MRALSLLLVAGGAAVTSAARVVVTNSPVEVPGYTSVWSVGTDHRTAKLIARDGKDRTALSGAVVCGGKYHAVWTSFATMSFGLLSVDLSSNSSEIEDVSTSSLFHALACDPRSPGNLLAVASNSAVVADSKARRVRAAEGASFHLKSLNVATGNETYVGDFPAKEAVWAGQDTIFSFNADGTEVWAAWPADGCPDCAGSKKGGHLHVMNTSTGEITRSLPVKHPGVGGRGNPYFVVPGTTRGVFDFGGADELHWVDLTFSATELTYKKAQDASELWSSSMPQQLCHGDLLALHASGHGADTLYVVKPGDGTHVSEFDFGSVPTKAAQACFAAAACA